MEWVADYGKTTPCCQRATEQERAENPERYDCSVCEWRTRRAALLSENAEAWTLYQALCGRTVQVLELGPVVVERWTAGLDAAQTLDVLRRLDLILDVLQPEGRDGRPRTPHPSRR